MAHDAPALLDLVGSSKLPFILEWKLDGQTPASLEAQLARTATALSNKKAPVFPAGAINVGGSRFLLVQRALSWTAASAFANSGGGHLAVMSNEKESAFALDHLGKAIDGDKSCWVGARKNGEDKWEYVTSETFDFVK